MNTITLLATANAVLLFLTARLFLRTPARPSELDLDTAPMSLEAQEQTRHLLAEIATLRADVARLGLRDKRVAATESGQGSYSAAERLARSGCPAEEIASSCGIPEAEARLVVHWHAARQQVQSRGLPSD